MKKQLLITTLVLLSAPSFAVRSPATAMFDSDLVNQIQSIHTVQNTTDVQTVSTSPSSPIAVQYVEAEDISATAIQATEVNCNEKLLSPSLVKLLAGNSLVDFQVTNQQDIMIELPFVPRQCPVAVYHKVIDNNVVLYMAGQTEGAYETCLREHYKQENLVSVRKRVAANTIEGIDDKKPSQLLWAAPQGKADYKFSVGGLGSPEDVCYDYEKIRSEDHYFVDPQQAKRNLYLEVCESGTLEEVTQILGEPDIHTEAFDTTKSVLIDIHEKLSEQEVTRLLDELKQIASDMRNAKTRDDMENYADLMLAQMNKLHGPLLTNARKKIQYYHHMLGRERDPAKKREYRNKLRNWIKMLERVGNIVTDSVINKISLMGIKIEADEIKEIQLRAKALAEMTDRYRSEESVDRYVESRMRTFARTSDEHEKLYFTAQGQETGHSQDYYVRATSLERMRQTSLQNFHRSLESRKMNACRRRGFNNHYQARMCAMYSDPGYIEEQTRKAYGRIDHQFNYPIQHFYGLSERFSTLEDEARSRMLQSQSEYFGSEFDPYSMDPMMYSDNFTMMPYDEFNYEYNTHWGHSSNYGSYRGSTESWMNPNQYPMQRTQQLGGVSFNGGMTQPSHRNPADSTGYNPGGYHSFQGPNPFDYRTPDFNPNAGRGGSIHQMNQAPSGGVQF